MLARKSIQNKHLIGEATYFVMTEIYYLIKISMNLFLYAQEISRLFTFLKILVYFRLRNSDILIFKT